jgi:hypothetical protein
MLENWEIRGQTERYNGFSESGFDGAYTHWVACTAGTRASRAEAEIILQRIPCVRFLTPPRCRLLALAVKKPV